MSNLNNPVTFIKNYFSFYTYLDISKYLDMNDFDCILGKGGNGVACKLKNGKVLKITSSKQEYDNARILLNNPCDNIVNYYNVSEPKEGIFFIDQDFVEKELTINANEEIEKLSNIYDNITDLKTFIEIINQLELTYKKDILNYLNHLFKLNLYIYDIIYSENVKMTGNKLIFFDIS